MYDEHMEPELPDAKPVYAWPGGKTRMLKHILPLIPPHTCYCEPFFGGGAVFFAKERSPHEVINDINRDLVAFCRNAKLHLDELLAQMTLVLNSRQEFQDLRSQPGHTEIQRAARWFIRHRLSFGGMGSTFAVTRTQSLPSRAEREIAIASLSRRLDRTTVENLPWERVLELYDSAETFFFLDPPYLDGGGAAYEGWSEHELARFCERVKQLRGTWMVTFQDCPQIREHLAAYTIRAVSRANGIGNNGKVRVGRQYHEVIVTSDRCAAGQSRKRA